MLTVHNVFRRLFGSSGVFLPEVLPGKEDRGAPFQDTVIDTGVGQVGRVLEFGQLQVGGDYHGPAAAVAAVNDEKHILMKQKEQLAAQEQKLEELTLKIEDVETLLDDVSDAAYDKAVEVVTDTVRQETHKEDIRLVEETKKWVLSPERKAPKKEREYAAARLDGVINKIKNVMQTALAKIQRTLMQPEVKQAGKEQVKKKAKESIMDMLAKAKINADRDNRERWEREGRIAPTKKNDIEL